MSGLSRTHEVSVLSLVDPAEDTATGVTATAAYCSEVVTVPNRRYGASGTRKRALQVASMISTASYEHLVHHDAALQAKLDAWLARERFDVVQFEFAHMASHRVPPHGGVRPVVCLDEHNVEYDLVRRIASGDGSVLRRAYSSLDWRKIRHEEKSAWKRVDGCLLTSARDRDMLRAESPRTPTAIVPNGVDLDYFLPADPRSREPATLLFFGAIDYFPNTDGILFFAREILPRIIAQHSKVRVVIVGRRPPASVLALASDRIEVTGAVDDLRPHLARATVVIVPLRMGGGTRLKILEAMGMGKAVVSTRIGAEGLLVRDGHDILLADSPSDFATRVGDVLSNRALADEMGARARSLAVDRYGWSAAVDRLAEFYDELIDKRAGAR